MQYSLSQWIVFFCGFLGLISLDLAFSKKHISSFRTSILLSAVYILVGILFGLYLLTVSRDIAYEYFTGFFVEKTLAIDNIFIIYIIFKYFNIPQDKQHKVLFIGILSALFLRGILIFAGSKLIVNFHWVLYLFSIILIFTGVKMLFTIHKGMSIDLEKNWLFSKIRNKFTISNSHESFFVYQNNVLVPTSLFCSLVMIEVADIIFAIDSIPAIFAITNDTYVIYTSNMFAILGLRSLYFALCNLIEKFHYLKYSLAVLLIIIGMKIMLKDYIYINSGSLLIVTMIILFLGLVLSIQKSCTK